MAKKKSSKKTSSQAKSFDATDRLPDYDVVFEVVHGIGLQRDHAWDLLLKRYGGQLRASARRVAGSARRGDECFDEFGQHLFAYNKLAAFLKHERGSRDLLPYLLRSIKGFAVKEFLRLVGKGERTGGGDEEEKDPFDTRPAREPSAVDPDVVAAIRAAIDELPQVRALCFKLRHLDWLPLSELDYELVEERSQKPRAEVEQILRELSRYSTDVLAMLAGVSNATFDKNVSRAKRHVMHRLLEQRMMGRW